MIKKKLFSLARPLIAVLGVIGAGLSGAGRLHAQNYIPQTGDKVQTENGVYVVKGSNLILNPTFDEGLLNWKAGNGTALSEENFAVLPGEGPDGTACLSALKGDGSGTAQSVKTGWAITEGKTYLFSCWAKRTAAGMSSNTQYSKIFQGNSDNATTKEMAVINYQADTWVQTQLVFTAEMPFCVAQFGWLNAATELACFYLGEVELSAELSTAKLEGTIEAAELLLSSTEEGSQKGQYTAEVRKALSEAIAVAKKILAEATSQQQINDANDDLVAAQAVYREAVNPPFTVGMKYSIIHNSGFYLATGGDGGFMKIQEADDEASDRVFTFVPAPEGAAAKGYNLRSEDGMFVYREGSWNTKSGSDIDLSAANAIFQVVDYGGFVQLRNMGSGSVLGTDARTAGSEVYSNKNGTGSNNCWTLKEFVPVSERDDKYYYEEALKEAQNIYSMIDPALCGVKAFMISAEAYAKLGNTIAASQEMTDYVAAKELLEAAVAEFQANKINAPVEGVEYQIIHVSEKTLHQAEGSTQPILATTDEATRQKYSFVPSDVAGAYYIKNLATNSYLVKSTLSPWDTQWAEESSADEAKWIISIYGEKMYTLQNLAGKGFLGCDATNDGSMIYCDKWEGANNSHWNVTDGSDDVVLDREAFDQAMNQARALMETMKEGYLPGEYFASDITAFAAVMAKAEEEAGKAVSQELLDEVTARLLADTESYRGKAHTVSVAGEYLKDLIADCKAECEAAVVGIEKGQYAEASKNAFQAAIGEAEKAVAPEAAIEALNAARDEFRNSIITIDRAAFKALIASAADAVAAAVAGDCDGQYPADAIETYKEALVSAQAVYNEADASQGDIDAGTESLDAASKVFEGRKVIIDFSALRKAVSVANDMMKEAEPEKGEGPGKYPEAAFDVLTGQVAEAQAAIGSKALNQQAVNDKVARLEQAIEAFTSSRRENDYSELKALIERADQLLASAVIGDQEGNYTQEDYDYLSASVANCEGALSSTSQDEIDRAVKILRRDINIFEGSVVTSVNAVFAKAGMTLSDGVLRFAALPADAVVAVYGMDGRAVARVNGGSVEIPLARGVYVVRMSTATETIAMRIMMK